MFAFRRKRALLLDDDAAMRRLASLLLKRAGYSVDAVVSGNDAIDAIENQQYTAILLDLMMPLEGGMTVIRYLRENAPEMLRRVIVITRSPDAVLDLMFIVRTVMELTRFCRAEATHKMWQAHHTGRSVLLVTYKERAELYVEQFASKGLTVNGSFAALRQLRMTEC